jgi:hypothetical protein
MVAFALPVLLGLIIATSAVALLIFGIFDADRRLGAASAESWSEPLRGGSPRDAAAARAA